MQIVIQENVFANMPVAMGYAVYQTKSAITMHVASQIVTAKNVVMMDAGEVAGAVGQIKPATTETVSVLL
jgi:hypothetical protein